ncbi:MAG TPA: PH domain-containing protein [Gaiellales bacterium]|jgi:membrane protein YdbS with pleckstrin-like domain
MAQIDRLLVPGEHVHLMSREHGIVLAAPFVRTAVVLAAAAAAAILAAGLPVPAPIRLVPVLVAAVVAASVLLGLARTVARWQRRLLVVTDSRVLLMAGAAGRRAAIVPLAAIRDIEIVCPAAGRMLHYGGVVVRIGGRREPLFGLRRLRDPDLVLGLLLGLADDIPAARPRNRPAPASGVLSIVE